MATPSIVLLPENCLAGAAGGVAPGAGVGGLDDAPGAMPSIVWLSDFWAALLAASPRESSALSGAAVAGTAAPNPIIVLLSPSGAAMPGGREGVPAPGGREITAVAPPGGGDGAVPVPDALAVRSPPVCAASPAVFGICAAGMCIIVRAPSGVPGWVAVTAPHCPQNFAFSGSECPHWVQERVIVVDPARVKENV